MGTASNSTPHIVRVKDFRIDSDYAAWFSEIKRRCISAQIKAAVKVNTEKLRFNWNLGRDLVERKAEEKRGGRTTQPRFAGGIPEREGIWHFQTVGYEEMVSIFLFF